MLKKLTISFDIDHELFARLLMHAPSVRFEAYAAESRDALAPPRAALLPPPTRIGKRDNKGGAAKIVLDQLLTSTVPLMPRILIPAIVEAGYSKGTVSTALLTLRHRGLVRHVKKGYIVTDRARATEATSNGQI